MLKAGVALSAGLAAAAPVMARTNTSEQELKLRLARLEDEQMIRALHRTYDNLLDSGSYQQVAGLFTDNAEVIFNGGVYQGKNRGIRRLYHDHFSAGMSGRKIGPPAGFEPDAELHRDVVEVAQDGKTATARFSYSIELGAPMQGDSVLVKMARLHGEGIRKYWEGGHYAINCVKDVVDDSWKITRLEHQVLARAEIRPGQSRAKPVAIAPFSKVYPQDPTGPDKLVC